jgi:nucleoid DNA-binding protein
VNVTKDLRNKLEFVKHIVGKETMAAIAKALQSSSPQDPWASFLATMIETIDLSKDGSATSDETIGLARLIKGFAESRFKEEVRLRAPMGARGEMYFRAAKKMYDAANRREEVQLRNCIDKDRLLEHLAAKCGISPEPADSVLRKLVEVAVIETNACNVFQIPGIGRIVKAFREPMMGQNPQNGEPIVIPAQTTVRLLLDSSVRVLCGDDEFQRSPGERTNGESGPPVHPIPVEGIMAMIDDLAGRLKVIGQYEMKEIFKGAATRASCGVGPLRDFYVASLDKGMRPEMARLTLARKIAAIALTLWKKEERFDAEQLKPQAA